MLPIFKYLAGLGSLNREELLQTFNLGLGMILIVPEKRLRNVEAELKRRRETFHRIGVVRSGDTRKPQVVFTGQLQV